MQRDRKFSGLEFKEDNEANYPLGGGDLLEELLILSWLNQNGGVSQNSTALAHIPDLCLSDGREGDVVISLTALSYWTRVTSSREAWDSLW